MNPLIWLLSATILGQTGPTEPSADRRAALEAFLGDARQYEMIQLDDTPTRLSLLPRSILNWGSAERNDENGSLFVWMKDGRPEVIGAIWSLYRKTTQQTVWRHGLQSLSERAITAHFESKLVWSPTTPGVRFQPVEDVEAPADNPQRRLAQMRNLAREFRVEIDEQAGVTAQL